MRTQQRRVGLARRRPIRDTLQLMGSLVRRRRDDRRVRDLALRITEGCAPLDDRCRMMRLLSYVKGAMAYERDPRGGDLIHDPVDTIERIAAYGAAAGDCDDAAVLLSALLETLGIKTYLTAVSLRPDRRLHHVAVEAKVGAFLIYLDPFRRARGAPAFTRTLRVPV